MSNGQKLVLYSIGLVLFSVSTVYSAHPSAPVMAYIAAASGSLGGFFVGAFAITITQGAKA